MCTCTVVEVDEEREFEPVPRSGKPRVTLSSVCLGCCHRIPETRWLTSSRSLFLAILEPAKSKIKAPASSLGVWEEDLCVGAVVCALPRSTAPSGSW